jgi:glutathione S-transferase
MIVVHHLNHSRSQRILWLLEELGLEYELRKYERDAVTNLAPPELKAIHPLGKSPVITDGPLTIAESGVIVDYLVRRYGNGRLSPPVDIEDPVYLEYLHWLHFSEGSAMLPLLLKLYVSRLGAAGEPLSPRIESELHNHFSYLSAALGKNDFLVADTLSGADIQLSFVLEAGGSRGPLTDYPNLVAWRDRLQARPAYQRALERGGPYRFAPKAA